MSPDGIPASLVDLATHGENINESNIEAWYMDSTDEDQRLPHR